jgi:prepilin-type N-terminal cleavage/methylation domain-containing protein
MRRSGFTLAELLIVLVIIAVLSYLLFPLFVKVKRQVEVRLSASKLRGIHLAVENYRQAWDGADVFTSYKSYYKLGLPPLKWPFINWGIEFPLLTDGDWRPWVSPCSAGLDWVLMDELRWSAPWAGMTYNGFIVFVSKWYSPEIIDGNSSPYPYLGYARYKDYIPRYRQNIVVAIDPNCNPRTTNFKNPYLEKRGLSLLLSGQVLSLYKRGDGGEIYWWSDPPED